MATAAGGIGANTITVSSPYSSAVGGQTIVAVSQPILYPKYLTLYYSYSYVHVFNILLIVCTENTLQTIYIMYNHISSCLCVVFC